MNIDTRPINEKEENVVVILRLLCEATVLARKAFIITYKKHAKKDWKDSIDDCDDLIDLLKLDKQFERNSFRSENLKNYKYMKEGDSKEWDISLIGDIFVISPFNRSCFSKPVLNIKKTRNQLYHRPNFVRLSKDEHNLHYLNIIRSVNQLKISIDGISPRDQKSIRFTNPNEIPILEKEPVIKMAPTINSNERNIIIAQSNEISQLKEQLRITYLNSESNNDTKSFKKSKKKKSRCTIC